MPQPRGGAPRTRPITSMPSPPTARPRSSVSTADTDPALASWRQIAAYWAGTDGNTDDYFARVSKLTSGNGVPLLNSTTVTGNGGGNTLTGNGELALIFSDGLDNFTLGLPYPPGFDPNSKVVSISP